MSIIDALRKIGRILFYSPSDTRPSYDLYKTSAELARLTNEITRYVAELKYNFDQHAITTHFQPDEYRRIFDRTFHYTQLTLQNQLVTEIVKQKMLFMERYNRCHELFNEPNLDTYRQEREEAIVMGQSLLKEIQQTSDKLPLSLGLIEF